MIIWSNKPMPNQVNENGDTRMETPVDNRSFKEIVDLDIKNQASPDEVLILEKDLRRWRDTLVEVKQHIETQKSHKKVDLEDYHIDCLNRGPQAKREYFQRRAEINRWNSMTNEVVRAVQHKLNGVKRQIRDLNGGDRLRDLIVGLVVQASNLIPKSKKEWHQAFKVLEEMEDFKRIQEYLFKTHQ